MISHYISDFPVDFGIEVPPGMNLQIPQETSDAITQKIVPFCESLKGKVISQFVDIERHVGHLITKAICGAGGLVSPEQTFEDVVAPHTLDRKIRILKALNSSLPDGKNLSQNFFNRIDAARRTRNLFAHGSIVFIPKEGSLIPVFHGARDIVIDDSFSKTITTENYTLIEELNACYIANFPIAGFTITQCGAG